MGTRQRTAKRPGRQGANRKSDGARPVRITAETPDGECSERLTAFGGLLALVKFLDLLGFEQAFAQHYVPPKQAPKSGDYRMVLGVLLLLFIGFQRLRHFAYVRADPIVCGVLRVVVLPAVTTFWRYLRALSIVQSAALLRLGAALRARVSALCAYRPTRVTVNIDTTVSTVYGAVDLPQFGLDALETRLDVGRLGHVRLDRQGLPAQRPHLRCRLGLLDLEVGDGDVGPLRGHAQHDAAADAPGASRHDGDLVL
jgi:hypothetical protein